MFKKIVKKFQSKIKNKGNNNTFNVNSPLIINQSSGEEIQRLVASGKQDEAIALMTRIIKGVSAQHPVHPHWRYNFSVDKNGKVSLEHVPNYAEAVFTHPLRINTNILIPEEITSKFKNLDELVRYSYEKQIPLEFNLNFFETWIGETLVERVEGNKTSGDLVLKIFNREFPPPTPMKLYFPTSKNHFGYDYLEIGLTKIEDDYMFLGNEQQKNCPVLVQIQINPSNHSANFNIKLNESHITDVESQLEFNKFLLNMKEYPITLKALKNNTEVLVAKNWSADIESDEVGKYIDLLEILLDIEKHYKVKFKLAETITEDDRNCIFILRNCMNGLHINGTFKYAKFTTNSKKDVKDLLNGFANNNELCLCVSCDKPYLILFGIKFEFKRSILTYDSVKVTNLNRLYGFLQYMGEGDTIEIEFVPGEKNTFREEYIR
ncbi:abortive infection system toxin AbiGii family protein [Bacillus cereus group sp. MYBK220-1]|uniref:abortive infection system toxin AbiGii family protein n=1 Tax=Bacillus cereus group sp. MYBK220-1 TaxID=3450660 RepID=UPI003F7A4A2C